MVPSPEMEARGGGKSFERDSRDSRMWRIIDSVDGDQERPSISCLIFICCLGGDGCGLGGLECALSRGGLRREK